VPLLGAKNAGCICIMLSSSNGFLSDMPLWIPDNSHGSSNSEPRQPPSSLGSSFYTNPKDKLVNAALPTPLMFSAILKPGAPANDTNNSPWQQGHEFPYKC
jgi:hypothetical protein